MARPIFYGGKEQTDTGYGGYFWLKSLTNPFISIISLYLGQFINNNNYKFDMISGYQPLPNCMYSKLRSLPIFHDEEFVQSHLLPEEQKRFPAIP